MRDNGPMSGMASGGRSWIGVVAAGLVFAILMSLGAWQMQRRAWKENLLATIAARAKLPPATTLDVVVLGCAPERGLLDPCEFRPVSITARLLAGDERNIFIAVPRQSNGVGGPGFWRFTIADTAPRISVNRGFVPEQMVKDMSRVAENAPSFGPPERIDGVLRRAEPRARFSGQNDPAKNIYYVRDPVELGLAKTTDPLISSRYYIDKSGPPPASGLPLPLVGKLTIPNRHLEYALTWFALALTWLVIAGLVLKPRAEAQSGPES